jgi:hypothetical protein
MSGDYVAPFESVPFEADPEPVPEPVPEPKTKPTKDE